jgi:hypothetical protein
MNEFVRENDLEVILREALADLFIEGIILCNFW